MRVEYREYFHRRGENFEWTQLEVTVCCRPRMRLFESALGMMEMNGLNQIAGVRRTHTPMYASNDVDRCASRFRLLRKPWLLLAALLVGSSAMAASVEVPNGDFSDPANNGSIGGLLGPNLNNQPIGTGPWLGTSFGILGILARPMLTVDSTNQNATIGGILANVGGLLNTGGWFSQQLAVNFQPGRFYVMSADVSAGGLLNLGLLTDTNVGIGLTSGSTLVAASTTAAPELLDLRLIETNAYRLRFGWFADAGASGAIGLRLFNRPQGLLQADLLGTTVFGNVELEGRDIGPVTRVTILPGTVGDTETGVGQRFPGQFIAIVEDEDGDGVPNYEVTIAAPEGDDSASADLSSPSSDDPPGRTITAKTDIDGVVTFDATANMVAGCFQVHVGASDPELTVESGVFHFRNVSDDPAQDSIYCNGFQ